MGQDLAQTKNGALPGDQQSLQAKSAAASLPARINGAELPANTEAGVTYKLGHTEDTILKKDTLYDVVKRNEAQIVKAGFWKKNESVWTVTQRLAKFNGQADHNFKLIPGKTLKIPSLEQVAVTPGEIVHKATGGQGLGDIAKLYKKQLQAAGLWEKGKSMWAGAVKEIAKYNGISENARLKNGQEIKIPPVPTQTGASLNPDPLKNLAHQGKVTVPIPLETQTAIKDLNAFRDSTSAAARLGKVLYEMDTLGGSEIFHKKNVAAVIALQGAMSRLKINGKKAFDFTETMQHPQFPEVTLKPVLGARNEYMAQKIESTYQALIKNPALPKDQRTQLASEYKVVRGMAGPAFLRALGVNMQADLHGLAQGQPLEQTKLHKTCQELVKRAYSEFQEAKGIKGESPTNIGTKTARAWQTEWQAMHNAKYRIVKYDDAIAMAKAETRTDPQ